VSLLADRSPGDPSGEAELERNRINLRWLVRLRWGAVTGQLVTVIAASRALDLPLPLGTLLALIGLSAVSNLGAMLWLRRGPRVPEEALAALMGLDVLVLTGLLALSGGSSNPFSTLYLVNIALAAVVLRPAWTWGLVSFSLACFGLLFVAPLRNELNGAMGHGAHGEDLRLHLEGMWVAFGLSAVFIVYFVQRVTGELARRDRELGDARAARARAEQLASLATLAAGAAHELATPLSTIAVVARELERTLGGSAGPDARDGEPHGVRDDARLIREQVDRCREILERMAGEAGETPGEPFVDVTFAELIAQSTAELASRVDVAVDAGLGDRTLRLPRRAVAQALRALAKNAVEAMPDGSRVAMAAHLADGVWTIEIRDRGAGMPLEVLSRVGEPFFTTKRPGAGMGLGVFLAKTVLTSLGGDLEFASQPGRGTTARVRLPTSPRPRAAPDEHPAPATA
jgi:two-component system sensor histidine kinase RegB